MKNSNKKEKKRGNSQKMVFTLKNWIHLWFFLNVVDLSGTVQTQLTSAITRIIEKPSTENRSFFTIVRFLNIPCSTVNGELTGTCFSANDCTRMQGIQLGNCASGFGVCCIFQKSCGAASGQNNTHFTNPNYPMEFNDPRENRCILIVNMPYKQNVCQIRLDFLEFYISKPVQGFCLTDEFVIAGAKPNNPIPVVCGQNTGQHMYIDVENIAGPIFLQVNSYSVQKRKWNIKISYLECTSPSLAPRDCLQYHSEPQGYISSFNFVSGEAATSAGGYLNHVDYAICFRKAFDHCSITYTAETIESFSLLNIDPITESPTVRAGEAGIGVFECPKDYLRLGGDRYCGARLNPEVSDLNPTVNVPVTDNTTGPFVAYFKSDIKDNAAGFKLKYKQNQC